MATDISANLVKILRTRTGTSIMECKRALIESQGNIELAIDHLRKSGHLKAAKRVGNIASEGIIFIKIARCGKYGAILELNSETDFVTKNHHFINFGNAVITTALDERISNIKVLKDKFEDQYRILVSKINENIIIRRLSIIEGDMLGFYLHGTRIGVIVASTAIKNEELIKHIAMHIAASKPEYVNEDEIPSSIIAREHQVQMDIAMRSGKSNKIAEIIVAGRMKKFTQEISLIGQDFVMDPSKTVGQLLDKYDCKINQFVRFEVGEGINKETVS